MTCRSNHLLRSLAALLARRVRAAVGRSRDVGASALEWAVIAAVVILAASVIGGAVFKIVQDKSAALTRCAAVTVGTDC